MRTLIILISVIGAGFWALNLFSGLQTATSLKSAGVSDFLMTILPFIMPLIGLSLSIFFTPWLIRIKRVSIAVTLSSFSLLAALLVAYVTGATTAG